MEPNLFETKYLILDADETLYPPSCGLFDALKLKARDFIMKMQEFTAEEGDLKIKQYFKGHGSILTGLIKEENIDPDKFNNYVFNLPIEKFITPNPKPSDT